MQFLQHKILNQLQGKLGKKSVREKDHFHRQKFINIEQLLYTINSVLKRRKIKKKRPGMAHLKKKEKDHFQKSES